MSEETFEDAWAALREVVFSCEPMHEKILSALTHPTPPIHRLKSMTDEALIAFVDALPPITNELARCAEVIEPRIIPWNDPLAKRIRRAEESHLSPAKELGSGTGGTCYAMSDIVPGAPGEVVVKVISNTYARKRETRHELRVYTLLKALQGLCIPTLIDAVQFTASSRPSPCHFCSPHRFEDIFERDKNCTADNEASCRLRDDYWVALIIKERGVSLDKVKKTTRTALYRSRDYSVINDLNDDLQRRWEILSLYLRGCPWRSDSNPRLRDDNIIAIHLDKPDTDRIDLCDFRHVATLFIDLGKWLVDFKAPDEVSCANWFMLIFRFKRELRLDDYWHRE